MELLPICVLLVGLSVACVTDCVSRRIPNLLTVSLALAGLIVNTVIGGLNGLLCSARDMLICLAVCILIWLLGLFRAGDAKLMAATFAVTGWRWGLSCFAWSLVSGAAIGVVLLLVRKQLAERGKKLWGWFKTLFLSRSYQPYEIGDGRGELPFAICITLGAVMGVLFPIF